MSDIKTVNLNRKDCPNCNTIKDHSEFYPKKTAEDGLSIRCKECCREAKQQNGGATGSLTEKRIYDLEKKISFLENKMKSVEFKVFKLIKE